MHKPILTGLALALLFAGGCGTRRVTDPPRTGSEQLLISAAVDTAVRQLDFTFLEDRRIFIDDRFVERIDKPYIVAAIRNRAWREGAIVVAERAEADYVMELNSGAAGIDRSDFVLGIPASEVPTGAGSAALPEVAIYKSIRQTGVCTLGFVVYRRDDHQMFYASGPAYGFADERSWWLFGAGPAIRTNASPERTVDNTSVAREGTALSVDEQSQQPE